MAPALPSLWLPILVAAVLAFVVSNLVWMVFRLHRNDWKRLPDEDAFLATLGAQDPEVGEYSFPHAASPEDWKSEEWKAKFAKGPNGYLTIIPTNINMGKSMLYWLVYLLVIELFLAYVGSIGLAPGAGFGEVFQLLGTVGILAFAGGRPPDAIWMGKPWGNTWKHTFDGILYGLTSALAFAWLWPPGV